MTKDFDLEQAIKALQSGQDLTGKDGFLTLPIKQITEGGTRAYRIQMGQHYPIVLRSWRNKWANLSVYFKYPEYVRKAIYTTNAIEAAHCQFRKLTKTKGGFPNKNSLLMLLYAEILNASKKWTMPIQNLNMTLSQLAIHFDGRWMMS